MPERFDAVVVGAGHNGLVAAPYLARRGLKVLILERQPMVGGACVTEELFPGYRLSSCSYICHLLQESVIRDLNLPRHGFEVFIEARIGLTDGNIRHLDLVPAQLLGRRHCRAGPTTGRRSRVSTCAGRGRIRAAR